MTDEPKIETPPEVTAAMSWVKQNIVALIGIGMFGFFIYQNSTKPAVVPVATPVVTPQEPEKPIVEPVKPIVPESYILTDKDGKRADAAFEQAASKFALGEWTLQAIPKPGDIGFTRKIVVTDGSAPRPPPVKPDEPVVTPDKPDVPPPPKPETTIIPKDKLRVIIAYESRSGDKANASVTDLEVRKYLESHCAFDSATKTPERRFWDWNNTTVIHETSPTIKAIWDGAKPKIAKPPVIIIANGADFEILPLPQTPEETLKLLKSKGGD
jgi:hypothetical protein